MAGFRRLYELLLVNINEFLDKSDNKEETLRQLIVDLENQIQRLQMKINQDKNSQEKAFKTLEKSKIDSMISEEKAKLALQVNNENLAKQSLEIKYSGDISLHENEIIYNTLNAQAAQLQEQLETLKCKLEEAKEIQKKFPPINEFQCTKCEKSKDIIDAELERLMNEIRLNHNLL